MSGMTGPRIELRLIDASEPGGGLVLSSSALPEWFQKTVGEIRLAAAERTPISVHLYWPAASTREGGVSCYPTLRLLK